MLPSSGCRLRRGPAWGRGGGGAAGRWRGWGATPTRPPVATASTPPKQFFGLLARVCLGFPCFLSLVMCMCVSGCAGESRSCWSGLAGVSVRERACVSVRVCVRVLERLGRDLNIYELCLKLTRSVYLPLCSLPPSLPRPHTYIHLKKIH